MPAKNSTRSFSTLETLKEGLTASPSPSAAEASTRGEVAALLLGGKTDDHDNTRLECYEDHDGVETTAKDTSSAPTAFRDALMEDGLEDMRKDVKNLIHKMTLDVRAWGLAGSFEKGEGWGGGGGGG
jgi:hypothetical protein